LPHLSQIRTAAILLDLEAVLHSENGQSVSACSSIEAMLGLARSLSKEPLVISQLARIGCIDRPLLPLERVVSRTNFSDAQLAVFIKALNQAENSEALSRALAAEQCIVINIIRKSGAGEIERTFGPEAPPLPLLAIYQATGLAEKDAVTYLDRVQKYMDIMKLPVHDRIKAAQAVQRQPLPRSKIRVFFHFFVSDWADILTLHLRYIAHLRVAQAALAVQRYRLARSGLPENISDIVPAYLPEVPIDPFDGQNIRYRKTAGGFVVYSIGDDGSDDGGREKPKARNTVPSGTTYDITFFVEK